MPSASFSARFAAFKVDILLFTILCELCHWAVLTFAPQSLNFSTFALIYIGVTFFYYCYPTFKTGQTIGKKWMAIRVVSDKADLTMSQVLIREIPGKIFSYFFFLGYLWFFRGQERKTWHDLMGKTTVESNYHEDEMSFMVRAKHHLSSLATIPVSIVLIIILMLYTSLPLGAIRDQILSTGAKVGNLSGSIAGGLFISEISRHDADQDFELKNLEIRFDFLAILTKKTLIIEKLAAEGGQIEVPVGFSWWTLAQSLMSAAASSEEDDAELGPPIQWKLDRFKLTSLELQNLILTQHKKLLSRLDSLSIHGLEKDLNSVHIDTVMFNTKGLNASLKNLTAARGKTQIQSGSGKVTGDLVPLLKVPIDFQFEGTFVQPMSDSTVSGSFDAGKIKFKYFEKKLAATIDQFPLSEIVKNHAPIEFLSAQWPAESGYQVQLCGAVFKSTPGATVQGRSGSQFRFVMSPKSLPNFLDALTSPAATLDDFIDQRLIVATLAKPVEVTEVRMPANLCSFHPFMPTK